MLVHTAKSPLPPLYSYLHFNNLRVFTCIDNTDRCLRASFAKGLAIIDGRLEALCYWSAQADRHNQILLEICYRDSVCKTKTFVQRLEMMVPAVTLRHVYELNGAKLEFPRNNFFLLLRKKVVFMENLRRTVSELHYICVVTSEEPGGFMIRLSRVPWRWLPSRCPFASAIIRRTNACSLCEKLFSLLSSKVRVRRVGVQQSPNTEDCVTLRRYSAPISSF